MGKVKNKKAILAAVMVLIIVISCMCTKIYSNAQILKEIQDDINSSVYTSTVEYLDGYVLDETQLHSDIFELIASSLSDNVASSLKSVSFSGKTIDAIDKAIEDSLDGYIDELNLTDKEKQTLKNNLKAIIVSSIYKTMLNKSYVTQSTLDSLSKELDSKINSIALDQNKIKKDIEISLSDMEKYVDDNRYVYDGVSSSELTSLYNQITALKSTVNSGGTVDKATITALKNSISDLQSKTSATNSDLTALKVTLSDLGKNNSLSGSNLNKLQSALEAADSSLEKEISEVSNTALTNKSDLADLTQKYNNSVNEYNSFTVSTERALSSIKSDLASVQTEMGEDLQNQISSINDNLNLQIAGIESDMSSLQTDVSDRLKAALDEMDLKLKAADVTIATLQTNYTEYSDDLSDKHTAAITEIDSKSAVALSDIDSRSSGALTDIDDRSSGALSSISSALGSATKDATSGNSGALGDIEAARQSALSDVSSRYSSDIGTINERIDNISDSIEESGYMKGEYSREGDTYVITFSGGLSD